MNHNNKPLTVDQMREMHDEVVIVKTLEYGQESKGILDFSDPNDSDNGVYVGCNFYSVEHYGDWWLAYAQKPIDFDAWKQCEICKRSREADPCYKDGCFRENAPQCDYRCDKFLGWRDVQRRLNKAKFCPECGRPLTDKARELLERRLSNRTNE